MSGIVVLGLLAVGIILVSVLIGLLVSFVVNPEEKAEKSENPSQVRIDEMRRKMEEAQYAEEQKSYSRKAK